MESLMTSPTVVGINKVTTSEGKELFQLLIEQEAFIAKADGSVRAGTLKCRVLTDWSKAKCDAVVNKSLPGYTIARVECEPYEFAVGDEVKTFNHTWILQKA